jgi:hypothetical protein
MTTEAYMHRVRKAAALMDIDERQVRELMAGGQLDWVDVRVDTTRGRVRPRIPDTAIQRFIGERYHPAGGKTTRRAA